MRSIFILSILASLNLYAQKESYEKTNIYKTKFDDAIPILNVATFHMGETSDARSTEFDENDKNQLEIKNLQNY